jgi:hypothetical protein
MIDGMEHAHAIPHWACCTRSCRETVTKGLFRSPSRSGPSVLPHCATSRAGTSQSAPAVKRRVHCKRSGINPLSHSGEHSAPSQHSFSQPPPNWPTARCQSTSKGWSTGHWRAASDHSERPQIVLVSNAVVRPFRRRCECGYSSESDAHEHVWKVCARPQKHVLIESITTPTRETRVRSAWSIVLLVRKQISGTTANVGCTARPGHLTIAHAASDLTRKTQAALAYQCRT